MNYTQFVGKKSLQMNEVKFETFRRKTLTSFAGRVVVCAIVLIAVMQPSGASYWEEDSKPAQPVQNKPIPSKPTQSNASSSNSHTQATKKAEPKRIKRQPVVEPEDGEIQPFSGLPTNNSAAPTDSFPEPGSNAPLQGKIEKTHSKAGQELRGMEAQSGSTDPLSGRAIDDELRGMVKDGSLKSLAPAFGENGEPLKGRAELAGGKGNLLDPDEDDQELMVEWDRWHNRFLRAVQLGMQEAMNNPDPEDYERPRVDPVTGNFTSRYPLGTGAAFSC